MYSFIFATLLIATASAASIYQDLYRPILERDFEGTYYEPVSYHHRNRRQLGSVFANSDHTSGANIKIPLTGNNQNSLSAIGSLGLDANKHLSSASGGLAFDNVNGHGLSLTGTRIPGFGNQLTGEGHVNLFHNNNHDLNANAFMTRNMPNIPQVPSFNTVGGGLDYMYKNKIGASLGADRTPFLQRTNYSAMGKLNIFRNPTTSFDFKAGLSKSVSPFMKSGWQPSAGFTLTKFFG